MRMPPDSMPVRIQRRRWMRLSRLTDTRARLTKTGKRLETNDRTNYEKPIPMQQPSASGASSTYVGERRKRANLPPFKLDFEAQQKPMEIQVLNDLVKHIDRLNVNAASYSTHPQSRHMLLVFANDSPTYEMLFESSLWPHSICGLAFKVSLPSRIPTSYSVLVKRVPREWHVDSIRPLIAQRYLSTVQVARIFRDGQPINRIRVNFRSNDDVQKLLQCSHISIDSIRYPAVAYKPLARIDRCFRCQQFGHKAAKCSNALIATPNTWLVHRSAQ